MEKKFGTPFVYFDKNLSLDRIKTGYMEMEAILKINIIEKLKDEEDSLRAKIEEAKEKLCGKTFIYRNARLNAFEVSSFMASLGIEPLI